MLRCFTSVIMTMGLSAASVCLTSELMAELSAPIVYEFGTAPDAYIPNAAPASEVAHDFNGDGKLDLVVSHRADDSIYFFAGNGDGTFQPAVQFSVGSPIQGNLYASDFDHDGQWDLFLPSAHGQAIVLLGKGGGTFENALASSSFNLAGYYPRGWAVGEFRRRGTLDIAFTLPTNAGKPARYGIVPGKGDGTFGDAILGPGDLVYSRWIAAGDFNRDNHLDVAVADGHATSSDPGTARMAILLGNGDATFKVGEHHPSPQFPSGDGWQDANAVGHPEHVIVADLAHRGILDVVVSDYSSTINVFMGNGDGSFQPAVSYNPGNYPRNIVAVDMNFDGHLDLVVNNVGIGIGGAIFERVGAQPGSIAILLGYGDGRFQQPITFNPSAFPGYTLAADFNDDGHLDLVTKQVYDGHAIHVMLNRPGGENLPPTFVDPPSAELQANVAELNVLADDDHGAAHITYMWSTLGPVPAPVTYRVNGNNEARRSLAVFTKRGSYVLQCHATDEHGLSTIKLLKVTVPNDAAF